MTFARWLRGGLVAAGLWLAPAGALAGPGYLVRVQLEPGVSAAHFAGYRRAVIPPFEELASRYASWHQRPERREAARRAAHSFPRRLATALRTTLVFAEVTDLPVPGPDVLRVTGALRTLEPGSADARLVAGSGRGRAVLEAVLELSDGASGRPLGRIRIEREAGSSLVNAAVPRSVEHLMEAAAADTANAIARLVVP